MERQPVMAGGLQAARNGLGHLAHALQQGLQAPPVVAKAERFPDGLAIGSQEAGFPAKIAAGSVPEHRELPTTLCVNRGRSYNLLRRGRSRSRGSSLWSEAAPSRGACAAPASSP